MRVLIVEDDVIIAMHLAMLVADFGYEVCATARNSTEALAQATALCPDVVLMDIRLAGDNGGVEAARELYASRALRCIFISANLDGPTRTALLPYEPVEFVGKPVVPVVLQRALRKAEEDLTEL
jgi:two-component system, response regulator PdtaR